MHQHAPLEQVWGYRSYQEDGFLILMDGTRAYKYLREDWLNHEMATSKPCKIASYKEDALDHSYKLLFKGCLSSFYFLKGLRGS